MIAVLEKRSHRRRRTRRKRSIASYSKADDSVARIERILAGANRHLREAFIRTITHIRDASTLAQLESLLEAGRIEEAINLGSLAYAQFANEWVAVYVRAAEDTAGFIGRELGVIATFDQTNTAAVFQMQGNRLRLITGLTESQRQATREALLSGIEQGLNPRETARAFRDSIGLTRKQESYVQNFRRELESNNSRIFGRELRDRRFDRTIRRAIADGQPLDKATIDKMVSRYRERWIKHRSEVIGRTESLRSVHMGVEESYRQAIDDGLIDADSLVRIWNTARDERVRDFNTSSTSHRTMHNQQRHIGEVFFSGAGNLLSFPGDPSAPPEDTIQCRCVLSTRFKRPES